MSVRRYADYRDSGVAWLGQMPRHWEVSALKWLVERNDGGVWGEDPDGEDDTVVLRSTEQTVSGEWQIKEPAYRKLSMSDRAEATLGVGDLLVTKSSGSSLHIGKTTLVTEQVARLRPCFSNFMQRLRLGSSLLPKLAWYILNSDQARVQFDLRSNSTTGLANLNGGLLGSLEVLVPTVTEQQRIVSFLDRETAKIDALVEAQQRLIELLKEKRQAVISHAVTKGLDPDAPMKDSGVEWLGKVPAHWQVTPIRKAARLESGHTPSRSRPDWWQNCTIPWFSLADVWQIREGNSDYVFDTKEKVSELGLANSSARLLPPNTVILSRTASVGYSAIMGVSMATTQDFANWVCGEGLTPEFLLQVLRGMAGEFRRLMMGSTHNTIYMPDIQSLTLALPPVAEQNRLVAHVRKFATRYDELTNEAEEAIKLLRERRAAIISAAVTGKIDVRGWSTADVRQTVAAEIIYLNARNPTFGRVKNQKLLYLAQAFAGVDEIDGRYDRRAAGPYDGDLIALVERELEADGVMTVSQADGRRGMVSYSISNGWKPDRERLKAMLGERLVAFNHLNAKLADLDTKGAEAVATLYAVWNDALIDGEACDDTRVIRGFLDEWHPEKREKFTADDLTNWLGWMRRHSIVPKGHGQKTGARGLFG